MSRRNRLARLERAPPDNPARPPWDELADAPGASEYWDSPREHQPDRLEAMIAFAGRGLTDDAIDAELARLKTLEEQR